VSEDLIDLVLFQTEPLRQSIFPQRQNDVLENEQYFYVR